jgi:hypothetical protein
MATLEVNQPAVEVRVAVECGTGIWILGSLVHDCELLGVTTAQVEDHAMSTLALRLADEAAAPRRKWYSIVCRGELPTYEARLSVRHRQVTERDRVPGLPEFVNRVAMDVRTGSLHVSLFPRGELVYSVVGSTIAFSVPGNRLLPLRRCSIGIGPLELMNCDG